MYHSIRNIADNPLPHKNRTLRVTSTVERHNRRNEYDDSGMGPIPEIRSLKPHRGHRNGDRTR